MMWGLPRSTLFPYTTLFRSVTNCVGYASSSDLTVHFGLGEDRKRSEEQRLNSSHLGISYAVFCLKKKKHAAIEGPAHGRRHSACHRGGAPRANDESVLPGLL